MLIGTFLSTPVTKNRERKQRLTSTETLKIHPLEIQVPVFPTVPPSPRECTLKVGSLF